jgi:hypothetical protein
LFQQKGIANMKTLNYTKQITAIIPRQNGTPAGVNALAASIAKGKELVK